MSVQSTEDTGRETAYERGLRHGGSNSGSSGGGSLAFLKKPLGPLPIWVWLSLGLFAALGYYIWAKKKGTSTTSTASSDTSTGTGTTDSSLIPQFVNQVYTGTTPPEAPPTTASGGTGTTTTGTGGNTGTTTAVSPSEVTVPNLINTDVEASTSSLSSLGLALTGSILPNKTGSIRWIKTQNPTAGTLVPTGSKITVTTAYGTKANPFG